MTRLLRLADARGWEFERVLAAVAGVIVSYLIGGVMGGDLVRAVAGGSDLRSVGSGNVGATNALRMRGPRFALAVLAIDVGKGLVAVLAVPQLARMAGGTDPWSTSELAYACGVAVALGHCFPIFHRLRGGKGVATLAGVFAALLPCAFLWMALVFVVVALVSGYVALASLASAVTAVVAVLVLEYLVTLQGPGSVAVAFAVVMAGLVIVRHRLNIQRLLSGTETRLDGLRLIGKRIDRWRGL